jgi:hypothetical protein
VMAKAFGVRPCHMDAARTCAHVSADRCHQLGVCEAPQHAHARASEETQATTFLLLRQGRYWRCAPESPTAQVGRRTARGNRHTHTAANGASNTNTPSQTSQA